MKKSKLKLRIRYLEEILKDMINERNILLDHPDSFAAKSIRANRKYIIDQEFLILFGTKTIKK